MAYKYSVNNNWSWQSDSDWTNLPFNVAAVPDAEVDGSARIQLVLVHRMCALVGMDVAAEHKVDTRPMCGWCRTARLCWC